MRRFIRIFSASLFLLSGCSAPSCVNNKPVSHMNDIINTSHNDTILQINRIATNVISTNAGIEIKVVKYMEDSVMAPSFDKESILMSIDNAIEAVAEQEEYLNAFSASECDEDKVGNLQLAITEYVTSLQALRAAIEEGNETNMQAALQTLQNAVGSLQQSSLGM